jgi:hypothetical protein
MSEPAPKEGASTNASAPKSEEELKRPKMKKGDYSVHVFVEDGRGFLPDKEFDTVDPLVNVIVFGKSKTTRALDDVGSSATVHWGEHLYFEKANAGLNDLEGETIVIEVRDHRTLRPDTLLGRYEFDVPLIYNRPSHAIFHQWLALCNPEAENFEVVRGYVKVSISVLHEDDKPVDLTKKTSTSEKDVLIPTQLKPKASQLIVTVLKADNLPKMDSSGTVDAYMMVRFSTSSVSTCVKTPLSEEIMSVFWLQDLFLPVMQPSVSSKLSITLWDRDTYSKDDMVGGFNLNWDKIKTGKFGDYFWANIYGAPPLKDNDAANYMNKKSESASYWRGRVLIRLRVEENQKKNYLKAEEIENKAQVEELLQKHFETGPEFEIRAQVYNAVALPKKSNYRIIVQWADVTLESKLVPAVKKCANWYENLKRKIVLIPNRAQFPDVFIYLFDGSNNISFARIKAERFIREDNEPIWVELRPDKSIGVVKEDWKMAFVKVRILIGRTKFESKVKKRPETVPNFGTLDFQNEPKVEDTELEALWEDAGKKSWDIYPALPKVTLNKWNENPAIPKPSPKVLWCHLFQCKHLPAADSNGTSDPYVVFRCDKAKALTDMKAKIGCLNPVRYM